jgi:Nucleolar protein,Nop52
MGRNKNKKNKRKVSGESIDISHNTTSNEKTITEADAAAGALITAAKTTTVANDTKEDKAVISAKKPNVNSKRARDILNDNKADDNNDDAAQPTLTRKQKRQKLNEKNKWPQHPKIANPDARERAYLRVAGIEKAPDDEDDKEDKQQPEVEIKMDDSDDDAEWRRFGRFLGAADARTRHKAVKRLEHYLKAKSGHGATDPSEAAGLSELDLLKIWKVQSPSSRNFEQESNYLCSLCLHSAWI